MSKEAMQSTSTKISEECNIECENGSILFNKFISIEMLLHIFHYVDHKSLLSCQLVCKYWLDLIRKHTWREKAELASKHKIPTKDIASWHDYYFICDEQPFNRNLIKNPSGERDFEHWESYLSMKTWTVECPPVDVPTIPDDPEVGEKNHCFAAGFHFSMKSQTIDLIKQGFSTNVLDKMQPVIKVSEWYSCNNITGVSYNTTIELIGETNMTLQSFNDEHEIIENNKWHKVEKELKDYGPNVRQIKFTQFAFADLDSRQMLFSRLKVVGACIKLTVPVVTNNGFEKD